MRADTYYPGPTTQAIGRARRRLIDRFVGLLDRLWQPLQPEPKPRRRATAKPREKVATPLALPAPTHKEHRTIQ